MRGEPLAKVITGNFDSPVGLITGIDLGVYGVRLGQGLLQVGVNMVRERPEGLVIAVEAMDVDEQQGAARFFFVGGEAGVGWDEGLRG